MKRLLLLVPVFLATSVTPAESRPEKSPLTQSRIARIDKLPKKQLPSGSNGAFGAAQQETTYFGGTFWNADSLRWEALQDSVWTFDSGAGSSFNLAAPHVDPYKLPGLHAYMEGWVGIDLTLSEITYFRRITDTDPRWGSEACVGASAGLGGSTSYWCGVFAEEANDLCYYAGQGYGDSWTVCIGKTLTYVGGGVSFEYDFVNETEEGWDYTHVIVDTTGFGDDVTVRSYDGFQSGHEILSLAPGVDLPESPGTVVVKFCFVSDGAWSDQDGANPTSCGAFAVDNVALSGGITDGPSDFETGDDGWLLLPGEPGAGGDWSNIVALTDLPQPITTCSCSMSDSVLVFEDLSSNGHGTYQDNVAMSPWIDLKAAGLVGVPEKFVELGGYFEMPLLNYVFFQFLWQFYPMVCPATGTLIMSPILNSGWVIYSGATPFCTLADEAGARLDLAGGAGVGAEKMRIALGMLNYCRFFSGCTGVANSTPWLDDVRLGVWGNPNAPSLYWDNAAVPQDAFPANGTLRMNAPGRLEQELGGGKWLGDEMHLIASTGGTEVRVQFSVRPGPGINPSRLSSWLTSHQYEETKHGLDWYSARMDSAQVGNVASHEKYISCYHEEDPNFSGTDLDLDPSDPHPDALANDIFPDDLFTPGTRVNLFYKTRYEGSSEWYVAPDTADGTFFEMEVFPPSLEPDSTFNCVLIVGSSGPQFETALSAVLPGPSSNFEETAWDRYDRGYTSGLGRPLDAVYGATVIQLLGYKTILWHSSSVRKADADVLIPWLTLTDVGSNNLYLSGDNIATNSVRRSATAPSARTLLEDIAGVSWNCETFRDADCPAGTPFDETYCVSIDPVSGAAMSTRPEGGAPVARGNGCPNRYSFDVLTPSTSASFGTPIPEEEYSTGIKTAQYASISLDADGGPVYRTVVDGVGLSRRRYAGGCPTDDSSTLAMEERLGEVLGWFGYLTEVSGCSDPTIGLGLPDEPGGTETFHTALLAFSPNPFSVGSTGRIQFTMAAEGKAVLEVFDINGRLVETIFDGSASRGLNEASWNGTDDRGRPVASGVYFYRLKADREAFSRKVVVLRNGS